MSTRSSHHRDTPADLTKESDLISLLQALFSAPQLRTLLTGIIGRDQAQQLPSAPASPTQVATEAVEILVRHGAVGSLFDELVRVRPRRQAEIAALASRWAVLASRRALEIRPIVLASPRIEHPFQGRAREAGDLAEALSAPPPCCVVVKGPAGIGKSTLTLHVLHMGKIREIYGARRWFVRLDSLETAGAVVCALATALNIKSNEQASDDLDWTLAESPALLVLDNLETPWEHDPRGTEALLRRLAAIETLALVVSIRGGVTPGGLSLAQIIHLRPMAPAESRALFVAIAPEHAQHVQIDAVLALTDDIPLVITLMARAAEGNDLDNVLSDWAIRRTDVLASPHRENDRLSSWSISLDISWTSRRMTDAARRLASLIAMLPDGLSRLDLENLLGKEGPMAATTLAQIGLSYFEAGRIRMLAPIREYAQRYRPPDAIDLKRVMDDHACRVLASLHVTRDTLAWIKLELANIDATIRRGLEGNDLDRWLDVSHALATALKFCRRFEPNPFAVALAAARSRGTVRMVHRCLTILGYIALARGETAEAVAAYAEALEMTSILGALEQARCEFGLGQAAIQYCELEEAEDLLEGALATFRAAGKHFWEARCEAEIGNIMFRRGSMNAAILHLERSVVLFRKRGSFPGEPSSMLLLGKIAISMSRHEDANNFIRTARDLYKDLGITGAEARCVQLLGDVAILSIRLDIALVFFESALELFRRAGLARDEKVCLERIESVWRRAVTGIE